MAYVKTRDGTDIYVKDWGTGRPVILIHGWPLSSDSWDPTSFALAEAGYRAIAYDRRGFGRSSQPGKGYDYDTFADDLADVMTACGANRDATIVGFSMGGGEVARYMSRHDGKGVVASGLIASIVPFVKQTEDNPHGAPQSAFDEMLAGIKADRPHFMRTFLKLFFGVGLISSPVSEETLDAAWNMAMQAGHWPTIAAAMAFSQTDFRPDLPSFRVPTLIIHGTSDANVPIDATARPASAAISGSTLIEYDGAPHGLTSTEPDRFQADLLNFLRS